MRCWLALAVGAVLFSGCATPSHERRMLLERTSAEVAYSLPPEQIMAAARAILEERGYRFFPSRSPHVLRTQWKIIGDFDSTARWSLVLVVGQHREDGRFVLRAQQATWVTGGRTASHPGLGGSARDARKSGSEGATNYVPGEPYSPAKPVFSRALDLEWDILRRLEPEFATEVEQQVDIYLAQPHPNLTP